MAQAEEGRTDTSSLAETLLDMDGGDFDESEQEEEKSTEIEDSTDQEEGGDDGDPYFEGADKAEAKQADDKQEESAGSEEEGGKTAVKAKPAPPIPKARFDEVLTERNDLRRAQGADRDRMDALQKEVSDLRREQVADLRQRNAPKEAVPDRLEDPEGYMDYLERQNTTRGSQVDEFEKQGRDTAEQAQQSQEVEGYARQKVEALSVEHPDYGEAYAHLQKSVIEERVAAGDSRKGAEDAWNQIVSDEMVRMHRTGGDPAMRMWSSAIGRGYKPQGGAEATAATRKQPDAAQTAKANRSVANAGATAETDLSSLSVDEMSTEQFDQHFKKERKKEMPAGFEVFSQ